MKKITVILGMIFFSVFVLAQAAFPWGWAVHLYVDDQLRTKWNFRKMDLLYGGLSPDILAYRFDSLPYRNYLVNQTHNNFMKVWHEARSLRSKAFAFGFVSHNEVWGIDHTAHRSGITFGQKGTIPGAGPDEGGYVIAKAYILKDILMQVPEYAALQLPDAITLEIAHELVESGVDILMKNLDPALGSKMTAVAHHLHPESIPLLEKAYAEEFAQYFGIHYIDAFKFIKSSEQQFRQAAALYGEALTQDDATAIRLLAEHLAEFGNTFLSAYGLSLPPGVDITPLLQFGISQSMVICADDFAPEVYETVIFVDQQLDAHGISFNYPGKSALFSTGSGDTMDNLVLVPDYLMSL